MCLGGLFGEDALNRSERIAVFVNPADFVRDEAGLEVGDFDAGARFLGVLDGCAVLYRRSCHGGGVAIRGVEAVVRRR